MRNKINLLTFLREKIYHGAYIKEGKMKKIFILGMLVVIVFGVRAGVGETVITTENEVISIENPIVVEPVEDVQPVSQEQESDETVYEGLNFMPIDEEPEPEMENEEYPVPVEEIPD